MPYYHPRGKVLGRPPCTEKETEVSHPEADQAPPEAPPSALGLALG